MSSPHIQTGAHAAAAHAAHPPESDSPAVLLKHWQVLAAVIAAALSIGGLYATVDSLRGDVDKLERKVDLILERLPPRGRP